MLNLLTNSLLSLLYPQQCGSCGDLVENASDGAACRRCWDATTIFDASHNVCGKCGYYSHAQSQGSKAICGQCDEHHYDKAVAAGVYHHALTASVLHLKQVPSVPRSVARCVLSAHNSLGGGEFTVIPVPLSKRRSIERGFNQAALLAKVISKRTGDRFDEYSLVRERDTPVHRAAMDRKSREQTVNNAFRIARPKLIEGKTILLVDDLMTSGSTVSQCAKVLKKGGAARVVVLTLARAA